MKLGYEFVYLYVAINPYSGRLFSLLLPDMTKDSFGLFNREFCSWLNEVYGVDEQGQRRRKVLLIADGAGAHQNSICEGCGISLAKLPAASPELNPVERFFQELRKELANHVFDTLKELEDFIIKILKKYYDHPEAIVNTCLYSYIRLPN